MPDTQPSASALSGEQILNIAYKRTWLRAVSFKSDEIIDFVRAIEEAIAALTAPVSEPIATLHDDGYFVWNPKVDKPRGYNYAGWKLAVYAAPQAVVAQPVDLESLRNDVSAIDTWYRGSPSYEHDAGWFKDRVVRLLDERIAAQSPQAKAGDKHD